MNIFEYFDTFYPGGRDRPDLLILPAGAEELLRKRDEEKRNTLIIETDQVHSQLLAHFLDTTAICKAVKIMLKGRHAEMDVPETNRKDVLDFIRTQVTGNANCLLVLPRYPDVSDFNNNNKMNAVVIIRFDGEDGVLTFKGD